MDRAPRPGIATENKPIRAFVDTRTALLMAGLATFWALFDSCFFSLNLMRSLGGSFGDMTLLRALGLSTSLLVSILVILAKDKAPEFVNRWGIFCGVSLIATLGVLALAIPGTSASRPATLGVLAVVGICTSILMFSWMRLCSIDDRRPGNRSAGLIVAASLALGGLAVLLISALQARFIVFAVAMLPILGIVFMFFYRTCAAEDDEVKSVDGNPTWAPYATDPVVAKFGITLRLLLTLIIFSIATAMAQFFLPEGSDSPRYLEQLYSLCRYAFALIVFLGAIVGSWKPSSVFRIGGLIAIAAYMIMPFLPENLAFISTVMMNAGYTCFELMVWTVLFESARLRNADALHVVGIGRAVIMASALVGLCLPLALEALSIGSKGLSAVSTLIAYMLIIAIVLELDESRAASSWYLLESALTRPFRENDQEAKCRIVADESQLTPREYDVMVLLASGRSAHNIAERLSIAESTVNYHVRHIYEKCGVRTKQDLIDKVDAVELP